MEVIFYSEFSKRRNSTKNPESSGAISVSVTKEVKLKGECNKLNPSFFVADVTGYVYCKAWGWYYFITEEVYDINGAHYVNCKIDVLGTWADAIKNTSAFVMLSSSNYNADVIDSRIAHRTRIGVDYNSETSPFTNDGCFIITTANNDGLYGGVTSYAISTDAMQSIMSELIDDDSLWDSLQALFSEVTGGVLSCRYVPLSREYFASTKAGYVTIGAMTFADAYGYITDGHISDVAIIDIPRRYSDFRNVSMTRYMLALPFIGVVDIDPLELRGDSQIQVLMEGNAVTGVINYSLEVNGTVLNTYAGSFGRTIPVGSSVTDVMGVIQGYSVAGGAVISGIMAGMSGPAGTVGQLASVGALLAGVAQATTSVFTKDFSVCGSFGGGYGEYLIPNYYLIEYTIDSQTEPSELTELYGRPLYKVAKLNTMSGFVETKGFSIDISAPDTVKEMINLFMDSGVYLE